MVKKRRDIEKNYPVKQFIRKLRRLARALEHGQAYTIQVANKRIVIPKQAVIAIEHERGRQTEEVEFQLKWKR